MAKITEKKDDADGPIAPRLVVRMADRMYRLGGKERRAHYAANAQARIDKGSGRPADRAIVLAAGGKK